MMAAGFGTGFGRDSRFDRRSIAEPATPLRHGILVSFCPALQASLMFLSVKELELRKVRFDETLAPGQIDFSGEDVVASSPLRATGVAELVPHSDGEIRVQGRYTVEITAQCDRCLTGVARFPLDGQFDLFYRPASAIAVAEEEVEIDDSEAEMGFYEGAGLELEDVLREQVLLALPMQRVCSEGCPGICPVCGGNRRETPCDCRIEKSDDRWAGLRDLRL